MRNLVYVRFSYIFSHLFGPFRKLYTSVLVCLAAEVVFSFGFKIPFERPSFFSDAHPRHLSCDSDWEADGGGEAAAVAQDPAVVLVVAEKYYFFSGVCVLQNDDAFFK